jgi:hypothetical protein
MSTQLEEQDEVEWEQAAYWQAQPGPAGPRTDQGEVADPPPRYRRRAALRSLFAARLRPVANQLLDRVRQTRPLRGVAPAGAGFTFVALAAVAVVAGSVALISYYGPGSITTSGGTEPSPPAYAGPPSDDIPLPSASPDDGEPSTSPSTSPSANGSAHRPDRRHPAPAKPRAHRTTSRHAATASTPRTVKAYRLVSSLSGKSIGVSSGSTADGARIVQVSTRDQSQQWRLVYVDSGYFNVVNRATGKALDNPDGSQSDGTQMQQWTITGSGNANQQWRFTAAGDGYYLIVNRASGRALDLRDGNLNDGAAIQQWEPASTNPNQRWLIAAVY